MFFSISFYVPSTVHIVFYLCALEVKMELRDIPIPDLLVVNCQVETTFKKTMFKILSLLYWSPVTCLYNVQNDVQTLHELFTMHSINTTSCTVLCLAVKLNKSKIYVVSSRNYNQERKCYKHDCDMRYVKDIHYCIYLYIAMQFSAFRAIEIEYPISSKMLCFYL